MKVREMRDFSKRGDALPIPNLIDIQIESYQRFLQKEVELAKRKAEGLEALLREVFPIESYDGNMKLEYVSYELGEPRYTTDECRALRLTYGMPFRIAVRLDAQGQGRRDGRLDLPGRDPHHDRRRRVHHQRRRARHRQPAPPLARRGLPGRDAGRRPPAARLPDHPRARKLDRDASVTKKDVLAVRIDQSAKIPATTFLRAMDEKYGDDRGDHPRVLQRRDSARWVSFKPQYYAASADRRHRERRRAGQGRRRRSATRSPRSSRAASRAWR